MFKHLLDGWKSNRLITVLTNAYNLVDADRFDEAGCWLLYAHQFSTEIKMHRTLLIDLITAWAILSNTLRKQGHQAAAERCQEVSSLLQLRFDAGEYYPDHPGAKGFYVQPDSRS